MKSLALLVPLLLGSCAIRPTVPGALSVSGPGAAPEVLPAGIYWQHFVYSAVCEDCATPRAAAVAAVLDEGAEPGAVVGRWERAGLPLGYPLVVHTDELGLVGGSLQGIAVVVGLFESEEAGRAFVADRGLRVEVLPLLDPDDVFSRVERLRAGADDDWGPRRVVRLDRGTGPVPAWLADAGGDLSTDGAPDCVLAPGSVFVAEDHRTYWQSRRFAPVACGETEAWVPWDRTLVEAVVHRDGPGEGRLVQVVAVECDVPTLQEWPYHRDGREVGERRLVAMGSCGE